MLRLKKRRRPAPTEVDAVPPAAIVQAVEGAEQTIRGQPFAAPRPADKPPPFVDKPTLDLVELLARRREHGFDEEDPPPSYIHPAAASG